MALKCSAHDCLHNQNSKCTSSLIQVEDSSTTSGAGSFCATHTNDQGTYLLTAMERPSYPAQAKGIFDSEIAEELDARQTKRLDGPAVFCGVTDCIYNKEKSCSAGNVAIGRSFKRNSPRFPCKTYKADSHS